MQISNWRFQISDVYVSIQFWLNIVNVLYWFDKKTKQKQKQKKKRKERDEETYQTIP